MLYLQLTNIIPGRPLWLGPAPWFRMAGNEIRQGPNDEAVAHYANKSWLARGQYFTSMHFRDRACVHFEDFSGSPTTPIGPFSDLKLSDSIMRANDEPLAMLQEDSQLWHAYGAGLAWPYITIKPARPD